MRVRRPVAAVVLAALGVACGPAAPSASVAPTSPSSSAVTPSPGATPPGSAPAPTGTAAPVTERFEFGPEVIADTALAGTDDKYINPGAVIEVDGLLHMFPNLFSQWPGRVRVPHLTSEDGLTWVLDEEAPPLDTDDEALLPMAEPGIDVSTGYVADDGTWVLYFETVRTGMPWEVWRATAPSPQGPWTISSEPVLSTGAAGAFDDRGVTWPSVVRVGDRWAMYYAGITGPATGRGTGAIGVAFSSDGISWTKHPEPVVVASEPWELKSVDRPRVVQAGDGLVMVYAGLELTNRGLATSTDGLAWTKVPGPAIDRDAFPVQGGSWDAALLYRDGLLEYFLEIGTSTTKVYRATLAWP